MRVAIVHDWLVGGGAERVVYELHKMYPDAPIYTSYCTDEWRQKLDGKVVTGFLQNGPFPKLRKFIPPLRIWWFSHLDLFGYDLVISSTGNGEAKGVPVPQASTHICYCHSPVHFYWRHYEQYLEHPGFGIFDPLARFGLRLLVRPLRDWDFKAAQKPTYFVANSTHIQSDIKKYYGRDSLVIHPPVDIERFESAPAVPRHGFVTVGRLVPHKHIDVLIEACTKLGLPLKVIGRGPEQENLMRIAGPTITFLPNVTDAEMPGHLASAEAFLFASYEDFGISPIEAMATGTPVIAYKAGGAVDYVIPGKTGTFFADQNADSLIRVLQSFSSRDYSPDVIKQHAYSFSRDNFQKSMAYFISRIQK